MSSVFFANADAIGGPLPVGEGIPTNYSVFGLHPPLVFKGQPEIAGSEKNPLPVDCQMKWHNSCLTSQLCEQMAT